MEITNFTEEIVDSDKPESDQHFNFPRIHVQGPSSESLIENFEGGDLHSNVSHTSLESDAFYSDLVFSETPSPIGFFSSKDKHKLDDWR